MHKKTTQRGFTLIEMAIVLVVIGLILGMVYKGRQLIDQARVKKMAANYNKIIGAMNTFYDRYGFYPGDGCEGTGGNPNSPMDCTNDRNGLIDVDCDDAGCSDEAKAFWHLLIDVTGILQKNTQESVFGQKWLIWQKDMNDDGFESDWLDLDGGAQADPRILCQLDQKVDDGHWDSGDIQNDDWEGSDHEYTPDTNCWSLSGQANPKLKILP
jgi:prepilin-type N-terminal cleavage/methylation domain-containing protein